MTRGAWRAAGAGLFAVVVSIALAGPAGASPLLANERFRWFWWLAPLMAISFFLMLVGLAIGYVRKVVIPRHRGRRTI